ncbi:hypothetical protein HPP92_026164 [Vanilla planifolia]|uniref:Uncharacterized protein n=1 Tax=Vanilla planifolia TaxID=51239 RepID=A0A835U9Z9_VANPL|nr:hypothetical protein HPP92_026164 [Vanilla planifolia]
MGKDKNSPFFDSVPSTPHFKSSSPPQLGQVPEDHGFNSFGRFDSFSTTDGRYSPHGERSFERFDSVRSSDDFSHGRGFSFDETDPFGTGPFKKPTDDHSPRKGSDTWSSF